MSDQQEAQERTLRLTHPGLDFWVDVRLRAYEGGTWIASADLDGDHDIGMSKEPHKAIEAALSSLGERYAREMAADAELEGER
jgi:hypothetical protein